MGPEGLVWETPFQVSGTFFMPSTQHWGLGEKREPIFKEGYTLNAKGAGEPLVFRSNQNRSRS